MPYAAGGSLDVVTRVLAKALTPRLGQTVVVENKPGAGSNIGADFVAKSPPDGYTLFLASPATAINVSLYSQLTYDPEKDLIPVSLLTSVPSVLIVHPEQPFKSIAEFVAYAKQNPGKSDDVKSTLDGMGVSIVGGSPAEFGEFLKREVAQWRPIVKQSGARVD